MAIGSPSAPAPTEDGEDADAALLAAYAAGDRAAAQALVARLAPRILAMATRMLGDRAEAEDVTQEAMLRLWQNAPTWQAHGPEDADKATVEPDAAQRGRARVSTWLARVALNLATDRLRRRRGVAWDDAFAPGAEPPDGQPGAEARLRTAERAAALRAALATLPDRQAQAVALRHLEGLSNSEIAAVMEIGVEAVESLTARGKRALAARLSGQREALSLEDWDD
ncbi:MAG: sigma-70 family RNA polymerase sigma factor [Pseudomonadota bacterium]